MRKNPQLYKCVKYGPFTPAILPPAFRRNGEGTVFTGVCPYFGGGGGVPHPADRGVPSSSQWRHPHLADIGATPIWLTKGVPSPANGGCPIQPMGGIPSGQWVRVRDWMGYSPVGTGWGSPPPCQDWMVVHPPPAPPPPVRRRAAGRPLATR